MKNRNLTLLCPPSNPVTSLLVTILTLIAMPALAKETKVEMILETFHDSARDRDVPVKIYLPKSSESGKKFPVIIFSHGLGGSREGYSFVGKHWAENGFVSVHLQHIGSDESVWKDLPKMQVMGALRKAAGYRQYVDRPADVSFVIDQLEKYEKLKGRLDFGKIGIAGHSFGAHTTLAISGQVFALPFGVEKGFVDDRVKAAIAMSPQAPRKESTHDTAFSKIKIPMMHLTGTRDANPLDSSMDPVMRQIPYQKINGASQYLIVFEKGDHMLFSGGTKGQRATANLSKEELVVYHKHILDSTVLFWNAWLKDDENAKKKLKADNGLESQLGDTAAKFEQKHPAKPKKS